MIKFSQIQFPLDLEKLLLKILKFTPREKADSSVSPKIRMWFIMDIERDSRRCQILRRALIMGCLCELGRNKFRNEPL